MSETGAERILPGDFFARSALELAPDLLGRVLVRRWRGRRLAGRIVETEAYRGEGDPASHAFRGPTARNRAMFGSAGRTYVYLIYGIHHCLNLVCGREGEGEAVLLRALEPIEGLSLIGRRRSGLRQRDWARGPGRLCLALAIDRRQDNLRLPHPALWLEAGEVLPASRRCRSPRIGVGYAGKAATWPWRFFEADSIYVSGSRRG